ncbi:MAG: hypothetical protein ACR2JD_04925 [Nocardioides sp.]
MMRGTGLVVAAAMLVLAGCGGADDDGATEKSRDAEPTVTSLSVPDTATATRCAAPSAAVLGAAATAFDGQVTAVDGDTATLAVDEWYAGDPTDVVEVEAPSESLQDLIGAAAFEEGERFLVAADERGVLLVCGYTAAYDDRLAALYAESFGG